MGISLPIVRQGDPTSHGGSVIEGYPPGQCDVFGKAAAGLGHSVLCPRHGIQRIAEGERSYVVEGIPIALEGMHTTCGAVLIATQQYAIVERTGIASIASMDSFAEDAATGEWIATSPDTAHDLHNYDERICVRDPGTGEPIAGLAYFVRSSRGVTYSGYTDQNGMCPRISTDVVEELSVWFGVSAIEMIHRDGANDD